jgi:hypothetical protein
MTHISMAVKDRGWNLIVLKAATVCLGLRMHLWSTQVPNDSGLRKTWLNVPSPTAGGFNLFPEPTM